MNERGIAREPRMAGTNGNTRAALALDVQDRVTELRRALLASRELYRRAREATSEAASEDLSGQRIKAMAGVIAARKALDDALVGE